MNRPRPFKNRHKKKHQNNHWRDRQRQQQQRGWQQQQRSNNRKANPHRQVERWAHSTTAASDENKQETTWESRTVSDQCMRTKTTTTNGSSSSTAGSRSTTPVLHNPDRRSNEGEGRLPPTNLDNRQQTNTTTEHDTSSNHASGIAATRVVHRAAVLVTSTSTITTANINNNRSHNSHDTSFATAKRSFAIQSPEPASMGGGLLGSRKRNLQHIAFVYRRRDDDGDDEVMVPYQFGMWNKNTSSNNGDNSPTTGAAPIQAPPRPDSENSSSKNKIQSKRNTDPTATTNKTDQPMILAPNRNSETIDEVLAMFDWKRQYQTDEEDPPRSPHPSSDAGPAGDYNLEDETPVRANQELQSSSSSSSSSLRAHFGQLSSRSVEEAVRDKLGCRPRANSTDSELKLPQCGLCDERTVLANYEWGPHLLARRRVPQGFHNLGNTCYLNSTLQCLAYLSPFSQSIMALPPTTYTNGQSSSKPSPGKRITLLLCNLFRQVHGADKPIASNSSNAAISPRAIVNAVPSLSSCGSRNGYRFRPGRQEDAHEFLVHLLDAMNDGELRQAGINQHISGWRDRLPVPRLDETTFVYRVFGGYLRSQVRCTACGHRSNTYDPFLDLSLEVSNRDCRTLQQAIHEYTRRETLDSQNKWKCSGCLKRVCAVKQLTVFRPPLSLCIQLKRFLYNGTTGHGGGFVGGFGKFQGSGGRKITKPIDFPSCLKLPLSDGRSCDYGLSGIVIHVGDSASSGHYSAYVKKPGHKEGPGRWYRMDDSYVEEVSERTVLQHRDAYLLFYSRKEVKLEFPTPPIVSMSTQQAQEYARARQQARIDSLPQPREKHGIKQTDRTIPAETSPELPVKKAMQPDRATHSQMGVERMNETSKAADSNGSGPGSEDEKVRPAEQGNVSLANYLDTSKESEVHSVSTGDRNTHLDSVGDGGSDSDSSEDSDTSSDSSGDSDTQSYLSEERETHSDLSEGTVGSSSSIAEKVTQQVEKTSPCDGRKEKRPSTPFLAKNGIVSRAEAAPKNQHSCDRFRMTKSTAADGRSNSVVKGKQGGPMIKQKVVASLPPGPSQQRANSNHHSCDENADSKALAEPDYSSLMLAGSETTTCPTPEAVQATSQDDSSDAELNQPQGAAMVLEKESSSRSLGPTLTRHGSNDDSSNSVSAPQDDDSKEVLNHQYENRTADNKESVSLSQGRAPKSARPMKDRTCIVLDRGAGCGKVKVMLGPRYRSKVWQPGTSQSGTGDGYQLLGTVPVDAWGDDNIDDTGINRTEAPRRSQVVQQMEKNENARKRKLHLDRWDKMLDQGKQKKVKQKTAEREATTHTNAFQLIQSRMQKANQGRPKGHSP